TAQVLFQTDKDTTAYDPETGKTLWSYGTNTPSPIVSAVPGEGMIFIPGQDFVALKEGSDSSPPSLVWKSNKLRPAYASALYYRGDVYALSHAGILTCAQAATGKIRWQERLKKGSYWASPIAADGHIYCVSEEGVTSVVKCGEKPAIVSSNDVGDSIMATPAIAAGTIYLRSDRSLIAVGKPPA